MRCEVVAIGTELLLGQIVDTNSAWIGGQLALAGIDSHFQTKVGDNLARIEACIRQALARSDAVVLCGGLGPTQDDITREAIALVMGVPLVRSPHWELGSYSPAELERMVATYDGAVRYTDAVLGKFFDTLRSLGIYDRATIIVTADHGNAEQMWDYELNAPHTAHTTNLVPVIVVGPETPGKTVRDGALTDVAPTLLHLLGIPQPKEMTGRSIID